jgi:hypothetical protein
MRFLHNYFKIKQSGATTLKTTCPVRSNGGRNPEKPYE